jgi:hypothetical protein
MTAFSKPFICACGTPAKKPKVARVAVMRKLVILMNRLLKNPEFNLAS